MLSFVSKFVDEKRNDTWYIIFQYLLKEDMLVKKLKLSDKEIGKIFFSVKDRYKEISYYWLQLGLHEQKIGDFTSAFNHLEKSSSIRPNSYKIQHAIARNFLRHANNTNNYVEAAVLFEKGEERMRTLIDSKEYFKQKAKPFSVNCYVLEKIKFINKFKLDVSNKEIEYVNKILDSIKYTTDTYYDNVLRAFCNLLVEQNKTNKLRISIDSPLMKYLNGNNEVNWDIVESDPLVESI